MKWTTLLICVVLINLVIFQECEGSFLDRLFRCSGESKTSKRKKSVRRASQTNSLSITKKKSVSHKKSSRIKDESPAALNPNLPAKVVSNEQSQSIETQPKLQIAAASNGKTGTTNENYINLSAK